jgi:hypothetical protein
VLVTKGLLGLPDQGSQVLRHPVGHANRRGTHRWLLGSDGPPGCPTEWSVLRSLARGHFEVSANRLCVLKRALSH